MSERLVPRATTAGSHGSAAGDPAVQTLARLRTLCLFVAVAPAGKMALTWLLVPEGTLWRSLLPATTVLFCAGMATSLVAFLVLRSESISRARRLDLGFAYQVLLALFMSLFRHMTPWGAEEGFRDISPVGFLILVFAAFVPNPPARTLVASLAAAAMDPLGIAIAATRGLPTPGARQLVAICLPSFGTAFIATAVSRVVHGLARRVDRAREMGSYRLVERLGRGGMGEVWRAEHRMLARPAAVKIIHAETTAGPAAIKRFEREAQATSQLQSPHTIQLYDYGVAEDGTFFYVMELLDGLDLETLVDKYGPQPAERVVHVLRQACDSLDEAHHQGLVHRDIKPANLYLCRYARELDFVKVLDFGLVKQGEAAQPAELAPTVTVEGSVAGTPAFIAPELAMGDHAVDGRADLYALGCVAYWLLTGRYVFEAETPMRMLLAHAHEDPEPPSKRTELQVPEALERLVLDCLAKRPDDRPGSARAVAARLDTIARDLPWPAERAEAWWSLHVPGASVVPGEIQAKRAHG